MSIYITQVYWGMYAGGECSPPRFSARRSGCSYPSWFITEAHIGGKNVEICRHRRCGDYARTHKCGDFSASFGGFPCINLVDVALRKKN